MRYEAGDLVYLTRGEYSSYSVEFLAVVLKPFKRSELIAEWAKEVGYAVDDGLISAHGF